MNRKNIQKSCEVLEKLLERDLSTNGKVLDEEEFVAVNVLLLELDIAELYRVKHNVTH
ncbi:hypothetical protein [Siminovitchia sp. 179-K 8D1 HS]|uniref:hypothetical protein n=1 Tax=Siminovitchia sp. 179-K 8D1 HS TaxID=3142385 RepID=UPI0039A1B391